MRINLGDVVMMRKQHPCGTNRWTIVRTGADVKIKCQGCNHVVMLDRVDFEKHLKKILVSAAPPDHLTEIAAQPPEG